MGGKDLRGYCCGLPDEKRFSNHADILILLCECCNAYSKYRFPRLIELCGASDALKALAAAHVEDDLSLQVLCNRSSWNKVLVRIKLLSTQAAVAELFSQNELAFTAVTVAAHHGAPVKELKIMLGKLDAEKLNILVIAHISLCLPLHHTAQFHPDPSATKLLARHHPPALLAKSDEGALPLHYAFKFNNNPAIADLLRKLTTAYEHGHFSVLVPLCGTSPTLEALAVGSTDYLSLLVL